MKTKVEKKKPQRVIPSSENNIKVSEHQIRQRAFEIYLDRNEEEGNQANDWFQAERELNPAEGHLKIDKEEVIQTNKWSQVEHDLNPREEDV